MGRTQQSLGTIGFRHCNDNTAQYRVAFLRTLRRADPEPSDLSARAAIGEHFSPQGSVRGRRIWRGRTSKWTARSRSPLRRSGQGQRAQVVAARPRHVMPVMQHVPAHGESWSNRRPADIPAMTLGGRRAARAAETLAQGRCLALFDDLKEPTIIGVLRGREPSERTLHVVGFHVDHEPPQVLGISTILTRRDDSRPPALPVETLGRFPELDSSPRPTTF